MTKKEMDAWMKEVLGEIVDARKKMIKKGWIKEPKVKVVFT